VSFDHPTATAPLIPGLCLRYAAKPGSITPKQHRATKTPARPWPPSGYRRHDHNHHEADEESSRHDDATT
jgi:hypothetical protein